MSTNKEQPKILITDYAWPDLDIEKNILEAAGYAVVAGPADAAPAETIEQLMVEHQPEAVLFNWAPVTEKAITSVPNLKLAARLGVGIDNLAVDTCTERGIWVTNVPDYCVEEVSDHAVAMLLAWARGLLPFNSQVTEGTWNPAGANLLRVSDLTVGILGYGRIGQRTASKLRPFGCELLAVDRSPDEDDIEFCDLETMASRSDVLIVHTPLTEQTQHLINQNILERIKPGALLINVSRGGVVDTNAVIKALESGRLSSVALDVLEDEPNVPDELLQHPNTLITPHIAFSSTASIVELRTRASEEVVRVLQGGRPEQARNKPRGK
jgi:D-3-phosphoglycerate dehydrogenase